MASERYVVRKAEAPDLQNILDMIQELADYEKMSDGPKLRRDDLFKDGAFGGDSLHTFFHSFVAEQISSDDNDAKVQSKTIGYTISFFSYSTSLGKCYFIEDIYVKPDYRKHGIGHLLFQENIKYALAHGCKQLNLHVLDWNTPAVNFYLKLGGQDMTTHKGVEFHRFNCEGMKNLLEFYA